MFAKTLITFAILASVQPAISQTPKAGITDCSGFELGPPPPPPPPGATWPDYRDAHKWCRANWCEIVSELVPTPTSIAKTDSNWSRITIIRSEAFFGDSFQLAFREFTDGRISVDGWAFPAWSATIHLMYNFQLKHQNSTPKSVSKAVPVLYNSLILGQTAKIKFKKLLKNIRILTTDLPPNLDDRNHWVLTITPGASRNATAFYGSNNPKTSEIIYHFFKAVVPHTPNPPLNSDAASARHRPRPSFGFPVTPMPRRFGSAG